MRLLDLDPHWIMNEDRRIGFVFRSPVRDDNFWQCCFPEPPKRLRKDQWEVAQDTIGSERAIIQGCNPEHRWSIEGGIENADFATISVTPSLDGSAGGGWHGHITKGEIIGGLSG